MKRLNFLCLCVGLCCSVVFWGPTENREWTALSGQTVQAVAVALDGSLVVLKKENGKTTKVPLDKLVAADQEFLRKHFQADGEEKAGSGVAGATGLPFAQGKVVGPVEASGNASYYLYLPTTLKQGRHAPLLFYTHAEGGLPVMLDEGAELC